MPLLAENRRGWREGHLPPPAEAAGISQRRLAFPGYSPAYISRIEAGERIPSLQILRELGARLDVDADFLATGAGDAETTIVDAEIALRLGELDRADAGFAEALAGAVDNDRVRALTGLGEVASRRGQVRDAIARFEEALADSDGDPPEIQRSPRAWGGRMRRLADFPRRSRSSGAVSRSSGRRTIPCR